MWNSPDSKLDAISVFLKVLGNPEKKNAGRFAAGNPEKKRKKKTSAASRSKIPKKIPKKITTVWIWINGFRVSLGADRDRRPRKNTDLVPLSRWFPSFLERFVTPKWWFEAMWLNEFWANPRKLVWPLGVAGSALKTSETHLRALG